MNFRVRHFGPLRQYGDETMVLIDCIESVSIGDIREKFKATLRQNFPDACDSILDAAALASGDRIYSPADRLSEGCELLALPPVCGG